MTNCIYQKNPLHEGFFFACDTRVAISMLCFNEFSKYDKKLLKLKKCEYIIAFTKHPSQDCLSSDVNEERQMRIRVREDLPENSHLTMFGISGQITNGEKLC